MYNQSRTKLYIAGIIFGFVIGLISMHYSVTHWNFPNYSDKVEVRDSLIHDTINVTHTEVPREFRVKLDSVQIDTVSTVVNGHIAEQVIIIKLK